jgi:hydroxyacylglutathione hydrolase
MSGGAIMKKWYFAFIISAAILAASSATFSALSEGIKDTESATHGDEAATYQVVDTYPYPGFKVVQFNLSVLSHYSYMLISGDEALVVDPGRDVSAYLEMEKKEGAKIKGVFLTHSHADFIAGHVELAKAKNCPIYASASSGAEYTHEPVKENSVIQIGEATIRIVETPGHTPDGLCAYVYSRGKKEVPELIFTGDTLFVGSIGRPDLMGGMVSAASLASMLFDSWNNKLSKAGDSAVIFPAHGAGSLCGAHLSDQPFSTIGAEKVSNPYLQHSRSRSEFIAAVLDGLPEAPQYFKHNAAMNKKGPELVEWNAPLPDEVSPETSLTDPFSNYVVDLRDPVEYAAGHIPNSVNIGLRGRLETWVGIMAPWDEKLVLCGNRAELEEATARLHRVGYRAGVISMDTWQKSGLPIAKSDLIEPAELYAQMQSGDAPIIVDVRLPNEWMGLRIGTVVNLPLSHLSELSSKLDPAIPVVAVCNSAYRSSMAVGVLERQGFKKVSSLSGGSEAWINAGLPVFGSEVVKASAPSATPTVSKRQVKLPERISPSELKRLILDLPGTFELVDMRPEQHFSDFNLPGSANVDIADLISNPAYLTGAGPLILVDRDGSLAMAVAGILSQKTQRPIKALHGGLESYWNESEFAVSPAMRAPAVVSPAGGATGKEIERSGGPAPERPSMTPAPAPAAPAAPQPPKKKSAGC